MKEVKVEYTCSDEYRFISVKGDYTKDEILNMAVAQNLIDKGDFIEAEYYQSHFKTVPAPKNSGYTSWNYPLNSKCRGSYFASVLREG